MTSIGYVATPPAAQVHSVRSFARSIGVEETIARAISFHPEIGPRLWAVSVEFDAGLHRSAGRFSTNAGITLHPGLRHTADKKALAETFLHEVAHAAQWLAYGEINHGASWWEMMHQLGQRPVRTHDIKECNGKLQPKTAGLNPEDLGL